MIRIRVKETFTAIQWTHSSLLQDSRWPRQVVRTFEPAPGINYGGCASCGTGIIAEHGEIVSPDGNEITLVCPGDWIIYIGDNKYIPVSPREFNEKYEHVFPCLCNDDHVHYDPGEYGRCAHVMDDGGPCGCSIVVAPPSMSPPRRKPSKFPPTEVEYCECRSPLIGCAGNTMCFICRKHTRPLSEEDIDRMMNAMKDFAERDKEKDKP